MARYLPYVSSVLFEVLGWRRAPQSQTLLLSILLPWVSSVILSWLLHQMSCLSEEKHDEHMGITCNACAGEQC